MMGTSLASYMAICAAATGPSCTVCRVVVLGLPHGIEATWKPRHIECVPREPAAACAVNAGAL